MMLRGTSLGVLLMLLLSSTVSAQEGLVGKSKAEVPENQGVRSDNRFRPLAFVLGTGLGLGRVSPNEQNENTFVTSSLHAGLLVHPRIALGLQIFDETAITVALGSSEDPPGGKKSYGLFASYWPPPLARVWIRGEVGWTRVEYRCGESSCSEEAAGLSLLAKVGVELLRRRQISLNLVGYLGVVPSLSSDGPEPPPSSTSRGVLLSTTLYAPIRAAKSRTKLPSLGVLLGAGVGLGRISREFSWSLDRPTPTASIHAGVMVHPRIALGLQANTTIQSQNYHQRTYSLFARYRPLAGARVWIGGHVGWTYYDIPVSREMCPGGDGVSVTGVVGLELLRRRSVSIDLLGYTGTRPSLSCSADWGVRSSVSSGITLSTTFYIPYESS